MPRVVTNGSQQAHVELTVAEVIYLVLGGGVFLAAIYGPLFITWQDVVDRSSQIRAEIIEERTHAFDLIHGNEERLDRLRHDICAEHPERCGPTG